MSNIVLDTSVLIPDFRLRSKVFRAVVNTATDLRDQIYLPRIVIEELINKFNENLQSYCDSLYTYESKIGSLIDGHINKRKIDVSGQVLIYSNWLQKELSKNGIRSIDYSSINHESLVKRSLARRRPFQPSS